MSSIDDILHQHFGLTDFRPMQREVIEQVLSRRDVMCVMPTGAGKSLCYQLPAVAKKGLTLVVSPLISLMEDQVNQLKSRGISSAYVNSSQTAIVQREILRDIGHPDFHGLLYVAPERFWAAGFMDSMRQLNVNLMAIDEAHCVSQWGHDFRPEYSRLGEVRRLLNDPPCIALTATATDDVREDIIHILRLNEPSIVVTGFDRTNLSYNARCVDAAREKQDILFKELDHEQGSTIVYCSTRKQVDAVGDILHKRHPDRLVVRYHAGMDQAERLKSQQTFMQTGGAIAVATNAFGMGINKPDIRLVVHYDLPGTLEAYYQEAGRAGRDGLPSRCQLIYHFGDRKTQEFFINNLGRGNDQIDEQRIAEMKSHATAKLDLMSRYAHGARCRRQQILDYFGDLSQIVDCTCDICADDLEQVEVDDETTQVIRQILAGVARLRGGFGIGMLTDVLTGTSTIRTQSRQFEQLSVFGLLKKHPAKNVQRMIRRVIESGLARQRDPDNLRRPIVELTEDGLSVMKAVSRAPRTLANLIRKGGARGESRARRENRKPRQARSQTAVPADPKIQLRIDQLRHARSELATEHQLPAYIICHDATLQLIAEKSPSSPDELELIKGMGPHKVRMYGAKLLAAIAGAQGDSNAD